VSFPGQLPGRVTRAHLGDRAAALVDGELDPAGRDQALAHLAGCEVCRLEVEGQRRLKAALRSLPPVPAPDGLNARLLALATDPPPAPHLSGLAARPVRRRRGPRPGRFGIRRPGTRGPDRVGTVRVSGRRTRRVRWALAGSTSLLVAVLGTAFAVGGSAGAPSSPVVSPAGNGFVAEHAAVAGELPFSDPAMGAAMYVSISPGGAGSR
jgi:anti-sigma factor RsiW